MAESLIFLIDWGVAIITATAIAYLLHILRQPLIPAYIIAGIIIGPFGFGLISNQGLMISFSELGIAFLLFVVGIELNVKKLKSLGSSVIIGGFLQVLLVFLAGFLVSLLLGFGTIPSVYLGLIVAFSSTMIVVKLLSDSKKIETLYGRLSLGILIVQDVLVIVALSVLNNISDLNIASIILTFLKGGLLLAVGVFLNKTITKPIIRRATKSDELLFITSLSLFFAFLAFSYYLGFSLAIGAFIAGLIIGSTPQNFEIAGRVRGLRDFFLVLFFVSLGTQIFLTPLIDLIFPVIILSALVLLFKPFIISILLMFLGYEKRTSFSSGIYLGQISEFSMVIAMQGLMLGVISNTVFMTASILAMITITATPYLVKYDNKVYKLFSNYLNKLSSSKLIKKKSIDLSNFSENVSDHTVIAGCLNTGSIVLSALKSMHKQVVVVDHNPEIIQDLRRHGVYCVYGDITNPEVLEKLNLSTARIIISTIPGSYDNFALINKARSENPASIIISTADTVNEALELYKKGSDYVILPDSMIADWINTYLKKHFGGDPKMSTLRIKKAEHIIGLNKLLRDH